MHPFSDHKLHPKDYIIWMGEMKYSHVKKFLRA
jgi:hypothetical protein